MMNNNNSQGVLNRNSIKIGCVYLIILSSIFYLIIFYRRRSKIIDTIYNSNILTNLNSKSKNEYPSSNDYFKAAIIILLIVNGIFLYFSYRNLQVYLNTKNSHEDINWYYENFYAYLFQFAATLIAAYALFIEGAPTGDIIE